VKFLVEIDRAPKPVTRRGIVQQGFGMGDAVAESHGVDERL
jgi:hypothetical protein